MEYKTNMPSFGNDRLNSILKKFYDKKLNIASYDEFTEKIRDEKKDRDMQTIINQTKNDLQSLYDTLKREIKSLVAELGSLIYPNISKDISISGEKTFGVIEFQNALAIYSAKPNNIHSILKLAIEHKRIDFVFLTLDLYMNDTGLSYSDKTKIQTIYDELANQIGFTEKQVKKEQLERDFIEVEDHIALINDSPENFEAQIIMTIKVARTMQQAGQLEGETILLSK